MKSRKETWQHPVHARGYRSPQFWGGHIGSKLTDKKIALYLKSGFYQMRGEYLKEKARLKSEKTRMVYDIDKQDFIFI